MREKEMYEKKKKKQRERNRRYIRRLTKPEVTTSFVWRLSRKQKVFVINL